MRDPNQILACPLNGKACIDGVREDFPHTEIPGSPGSFGSKLKCRWWQHLYGKDPQSEKMIDQWDCAVAWLPITTIETSQMAKQTSASVDKMANQVNELAINSAGQNIRQGIETGRAQERTLLENGTR
jgi:hypothetical protein